MENEKLVVQNTPPLLSAPQNEAQPKESKSIENGENTVQNTQGIFPTPSIILPPDDKKTKYTLVDFIYVFVFGILGYLYYISFPYIWMGGVGAFLFTSAFVVCFGSYIRLKTEKPLPKQSFFWLAILLLTGLSYACYTNNVFGGANSLFLHCVAIYWVLSATGSLIDKQTGKYFLLDGIYGLVIYPFAKFFSPIVAIKKGIQNKFKNFKTEKLGTLLGGVLLGVLAFCLVLPLLLSADENFANIFNNFRFISLNSATIVIFIISIIIGAFFFSLAISTCSEKTDRKTSIEKNIKSLGIIPHTSVNIALAMLAILYAVFIGTTLFSLINIVSQLNMQGIYYSQYAREGFFELCKVAVITIIILAIAGIAAKKENQNTKVQTALLVALSVLSLCLVAIAALKMWLYVNAYGLTPKRFFASIFMLFLAMVFIMIIINEFKKFDYIRVAIITFCVGTCFLLLVNCNLIITSYNMAQYSAGTLKWSEHGDITPEYDNAAAILKFYNTLPDDNIYKETIKNKLIRISRYSDNSSNLFECTWIGARASRIEGYLLGLNNY